jgi:hypothetical protein
MNLKNLMMGCFSFICKKSGEPVLSSSFSGDSVHLFLLKKGKVVEHMYGNYDSYGRVFGNEKDPEDKSFTEETSFNWNIDWGDVCDLMFDEDKSNGIAAILSPYWEDGDPYPTKRSESDPNQGWGEHMELIGSVSEEIGKKVKKAYHKTYNDGKNI